MKLRFIPDLLDHFGGFLSTAADESYASSIPLTGNDGPHGDAPFGALLQSSLPEPDVLSTGGQTSPSDDIAACIREDSITDQLSLSPDTILVEDSAGMTPAAISSVPATSLSVSLLAIPADPATGLAGVHLAATGVGDGGTTTSLTHMGGAVLAEAAYNCVVVRNSKLTRR